MNGEEVGFQQRRINWMGIRQRKGWTARWMEQRNNGYGEVTNEGEGKRKRLLWIVLVYSSQLFRHYPCLFSIGTLLYPSSTWKSMQIGVWCWEQLYKWTRRGLLWPPSCTGDTTRMLSRQRRQAWPCNRRIPKWHMSFRKSGCTPRSCSWCHGG